MLENFFLKIIRIIKEIIWNNVAIIVIKIRAIKIIIAILIRAIKKLVAIKLIKYLNLKSWRLNKRFSTRSKRKLDY